MALSNFFHPYGIILGLAIAFGVWIVGKISKYFRIKTGWLDDSLIYMLVGAVVGARLYHLLTDWQLYTHASLLDLVAIWRGGIGFLGAILGGAIGLALWTYRKNHYDFLQQLFTYLDLLVFGIPLAQAIGRLGNFVNQELYGLPTTLPWGILINGQRFHPLFLYEAILNCLLFGLLLLLARRKSFVLGKGQYLCLYLFGYSLIRFWLEFLRIQTARLDGTLGVFSIAQWVTLVFMIVTTVVFWVRRHAPRKAWDFTLE